MNRTKKLTEEQVQKVVDNAIKERDIYQDVIRGVFCKIIKDLYDPYVQPKYRIMKSYKKIDDNEIELTTKDGRTINITYDKQKHLTFIVTVGDKSFGAKRQSTVVDVIKFIL